MESHYLRPFGLGANGLKIVSLDFPSPDQPIILGRNQITGLDVSTADNVQYISRTHAEISQSNGKLFIKAKSKQDGLVYRNGESIAMDTFIELVCGDKISLVGHKKHFNYELIKGEMSPAMIEACYLSSLAVLDARPSKRRKSDSFDKLTADVDLSLHRASQASQNTETALDLNSSGQADSASSSSSSSSSSSTSKIEVAAAPSYAKLEAHYECSICCDTMACSHSLSPCGDVFCYSCIADWAKKNKNCPLCSVDFDLKAALPNRSMDSIIREVLTADPDKLVLFGWEDRVLQGINRKKGIKHVPLKPPPTPPAPVRKPAPAVAAAAVRTPTATASAASASAAALVPGAAAAVPVEDPKVAEMRKYVCRANAAQSGKFLIVPATPLAPATAAAPGVNVTAAALATANAAMSIGAGAGRLIDLTADDSQTAQAQAQVGNQLYRKAHASYGVGIERLKCNCGALIKPKHVRIRITDTRTTTVSFYYHSWCLSSLSFRQHQISFEKISGKEKLKPEDQEQLRLNYDLVV
jgi:Ring finger domain